VTVDADSLVTIVSEWVDLERRVLEAARERFGEKGRTSFAGALNALLEAGSVSPATAEALRGLHSLRNLAVYAPDDKALAARVPHFRSMSQAMRWSLDRARPEQVTMTGELFRRSVDRGRDAAA